MDSGIVFWLVMGGIVIASVIGSNHTQAKKIALIENLIEKGLPIPPGLLEGRKLYDWRGFMVGGIILLAAGIAMLIFFTALITWQVTDMQQRFLPSIAAFPLLIGAACLLIARRLKRNE